MRSPLQSAAAIALALSAGAGGETHVLESHRGPRIVAPPSYHFSSGRFDPHWWLRRGARRNQRERRRDRRRAG